MAGPKVANFSTGVQPPYAAERADVAAEQAMLLRALQEQMQTGFSRPGIRAGNAYIPDLGGLGSAIAARGTRADIDLNRKKAADLEGKYQDELVKELRKYRVAESGQDVALDGPTMDGQPLVGRIPGDPQAYKGFRDSPFPEIRGEARLAEELYRKQFDELSKRASFPSVQQALQSGQSIQALKPKPEYQALGKSLVETTETGQPPTVVPSMRVTQSTLPSGTVVNNYATGEQDAVDKATKVSQNNIMGADNLLMKEEINALPKEYESAQKYAKGIKATETALNALANGARTGFGQDWIQNAQTAITNITGIPFEGVTSSGVLAKALAEATIAELGSLGNQISNADRQFMSTATGGTADDPKALERILAIRAAALSKGLARHNQNIENLASDPKVGSGERTRSRWSVQHPAAGFQFQTKEALASYLSGMYDLPYTDALSLASKKENAPDAPAGSTPASEAAIKKRMEALGLPYTPPAKGK